MFCGACGLRTRIWLTSVLGENCRHFKAPSHGCSPNSKISSPTSGQTCLGRSHERPPGQPRIGVPGTEPQACQAALQSPPPRCDMQIATIPVRIRARSGLFVRTRAKSRWNLHQSPFRAEDSFFLHGICPRRRTKPRIGSWTGTPFGCVRWKPKRRLLPMRHIRQPPTYNVRNQNAKLSRVGSHAPRVGVPRPPSLLAPTDEHVPIPDSSVSGLGTVGPIGGVFSASVPVEEAEVRQCNQDHAAWQR